MPAEPAASRRAAAPPWDAVRAEAGAQVRLAAPLAATQLGEIAIETTDVMMLGRLGPEALAAGTLGAHYAFFVLLFGFGVVTAVQPLVAQAKGARDVRGMRRYVRQGLWAAALTALPVMAAFAAGAQILVALGQAPDSADRAGGYLVAALGMVPGALAFMALRGFVAALDRPGLALWVMLGGVAANAGLNGLLIFGALGFPRLELVGAGLASSFVNLGMAGALALLIARHRRLRRYHVFARLWRPDRARLRRLFAVGVPMALTLICEAGIFTASTIMMGWLGPEPLAAHGIALQIAAVIFMIPLGIGLSATVRVGQAHGAHDAAAVRRAGVVAYGLGIAVMAVATVILLAIPDTLIALFLPVQRPGNAEVVAIARDLLVLAAVFQLADGAQVIGINALRGLTDTRVPLAFALLGYWGGGIGTGWLLGIRLGYGGEGVWAGLAVGLGVVAMLLAARFARLSHPSSKLMTSL